MDHPRIDDALEASSSYGIRDSTGRAVRRRHVAMQKRRPRRVVRRDAVDSDEGSGADSGPDSDDEDAVFQHRPNSLARPSATLRVVSGSGVSSRTTIRVAQPTAIRFAPPTTTRAALPLFLGSTLLAADGDDIDSGVDSLSEDDDSDDETTTTLSTATTAPAAGQTNATVTQSTTSVSLTSTTAAAAASSSKPIAAPPPPINHTSPPATSTSSTLAQPTTLSTAIVAAPASDTVSRSSSKSSTREQTVAATTPLTTAPAVTTTPLPTLTAPYPQLAPTPATAASDLVEGVTPGLAVGSKAATEQKPMHPGAIAGIVIGVLAGVGILLLAAVFFMKKLRGRGYNLPAVRLPFSRPGSDSRAGTTWTWNRNLWGAASNSSSSSGGGPRSTIFGSRAKNLKTNSEMLDELVQASYAAEGGGVGNIPAAEKSRRRQTDLESQPAPPSPGSFLDENFLDEKAYAKLEGPWPLKSAPRGAGGGGGRRPKTPGPVSRWLDGILTPRQSAVQAPRLVPQGNMSTPWRPEPPLPVPAAAVVGAAGKPVRDTRMTRTSTTSSSVVW